MISRARGFTLVELVVVVVASLLIAVVLALPTLGRGHRSAPSVKDASQVRGILQSMVIWAGNNADQMPLPSLLDLEDATVPETGAAKDTTGNILSLLIYNGLFPPELAVSPGETGNVRSYKKYETSMPSAAVNPARALWDPAFTADFTARPPGNTSYAMMSLTRGRQAAWAWAFDATRAVVGVRGPQVSSVGAGADGPTATLANPRSNTLRFFGPRDVWHGNIGYQDNHVDFKTEMAPDDLLYLLPGGTLQRDNLFYDEPDDGAGDNNYLTVTIPAAGVGGGRAIWD